MLNLEVYDNALGETQDFSKNQKAIISEQNDDKKESFKYEYCFNQKHQ